MKLVIVDLEKLNIAVGLVKENVGNLTGQAIQGAIQEAIQGEYTEPKADLDKAAKATDYDDSEEQD